MKDGVARKLGRATAHRWSMLRCVRQAAPTPGICVVSSRMCKRHGWLSSNACAHASRSCSTMVSQLIDHERIETTVHKAREPEQRTSPKPSPDRPILQAKELRKVADHMVSLGKEGTLAARRRAAAVVRGDAVLQKLFGSLAERYAGRPGGYTRVLQTRRRVGDGAQMAYIEYVDREGELRPAMAPTAAAAADAAWARQRAALWTRGGLSRAAAKAPDAASTTQPQSSAPSDA